MGVQVTVWPRGTRRVRTSGPFGVDWTPDTRRVGTPLFVSDYGSLIGASASTRYEPGFGGYDLASWEVKPFGGYVGGLMRPGDHVRITKGGGTVFEGEYSEAEPRDDGSISLKAKGYAYNLYDYDSIYWDDVPAGTDIYYPTTKLGSPSNTLEPFDGWAYAVQVLGMPINQIIGSTSTWTTAFGSSSMSSKPLKLGDLVTSVQQELSQRWAVWGRALVLAADPTTPVWSYSPPEGLIGVADTDYATHVYVWYVSSQNVYVQPWLVGTAYVVGNQVSFGGQWWKAKVNNTGVTPVQGATWDEIPIAYRKQDFSMVVASDTVDRIARFDTRTAVVDYRGLGIMTAVRAQALAQSLLDQVKGRFILTGGFTVGPEDGFSSANGGKADIAFPRAGQMLKIPGLRTDQGNLMDTDTFIIGKTDWSYTKSTDQDTLQVTPMGAVSRNLSELLKGEPLASTVAVAG